MELIIGIAHASMMGAFYVAIWIALGFGVMLVLRKIVRWIRFSRDVIDAESHHFGRDFSMIQYPNGYRSAMNPHIVDDLTGHVLGLDFLVADLNHDAQKSMPMMGDAVIVLDIDSMGVTVKSDTRGNFYDGIPIRQPAERHEPAHDGFKVWMTDGKDVIFKRYQIRPCGLAKRTWVVVL